MSEAQPQLESYVHFNGDCAQAVRFYTEAVGARVETLLKASDTPVGDQMPPEKRDWVMHASLLIGDRRQMMSDWMAPAPYPSMKGFSLSLAYASVDEARRVFDALADGGNVTMPFGPTFWSEGFGQVVDRFGTPWMVSGPMAAS